MSAVPIGGATANLGLSYTDNGMPVDGSSLKGTTLDGALALPQIAGTAISFTGRYGGSIATSFPIPAADRACRCCAAWTIATSRKACSAPMPARYDRLVEHGAGLWLL